MKTNIERARANLLVLWKGSEHTFCYFPTRQQVVNHDSASLQTKHREAVVIPLPISMHTGQIIMLTKMLTSSDLRFYGFEGGAPVHRWH